MISRRVAERFAPLALSALTLVAALVTVVEAPPGPVRFLAVACAVVALGTTLLAIWHALSTPPRIVVETPAPAREETPAAPADPPATGVRRRILVSAGAVRFGSITRWERLRRDHGDAGARAGSDRRP